MITIAPFSLKLTPRAFNREFLAHTIALNLSARLGTRRRGLAVASVSCVAPVKFLDPRNEFNADRMREKMLLIGYHYLSAE